jgi:glycerate kinase
VTEDKEIMKVVVAIDSFKGSMTSIEAGRAVAEGIHRVDPSAEVIVRPLADGGEGTVEALAEGMNGTLKSIIVVGPREKRVNCTYCILKETNTAIIEMSGTSGITLLTKAERNPLYTTTYGLGEVIKAALAQGCRNFIIGIGGSATNDAGVGMLQALGFRFLDKNGRQVRFGALGVRDIVSIKTETIIPELEDCFFKIACDVTNPLCGQSGCSAVFGPQKGATLKMTKDMDKWLSAFARTAASLIERADPECPGAGAAGGLGFAFQAFLNSELISGVKVILEVTKLEEYIAGADLVITGEGRLDSQTTMGKAPIGVAGLAQKYGKPVIALAGSVAPEAVDCNKNGIDAFFPILRRICSLEEAMDTDNAKKNTADAAEQAYRLFTVARQERLLQ